MTSFRSGLFIFGTSLLIEAVSCLKLTDLVVPKYVDRASSAKLTCNFDTERNKLYSVKWYKDENEFYRFMPGDKPQSQVFSLEGATLEESLSGIEHVVLSNFQFSGTGSYRCEVSTEGPNFETVYLTHNITVLAYPHQLPRLEGLEDTYAINDMVTCNCTAAPSRPAPTLYWYINNEKATYIVDQTSNVVDHPDNTSTVSSMLRFTVDRHHFLGSEGLLTLRCEAVAPPLDPVSSTVTASWQGAQNQRLAQGDYMKSDAKLQTLTGYTLVIGLLLFVT